MEKSCYEDVTLCHSAWSIWNIKKDLVFNNVQPDCSALVGLVKVRIAFWVKFKWKRYAFSVNDFFYNLQSIKHNT